MRDLDGEPLLIDAQPGKVLLPALPWLVVPDLLSSEVDPIVRLLLMFGAGR